MSAWAAWVEASSKLRIGSDVVKTFIDQIRDRIESLTLVEYRIITTSKNGNKDIFMKTDSLSVVWMALAHAKASPDIADVRLQTRCVIETPWTDVSPELVSQKETSDV